MEVPVARPYAPADPLVTFSFRLVSQPRRLKDFHAVSRRTQFDAFRRWME
jgi:hypothetical protein